MHYLYIVYSESTDSYYTGETYNLINRLQKHNSGFYKRGYSRKAKDWMVVFSYICNDRSDAIYLERFIKRMKSRTFVEKLILNPKILENILDKR